MLNIADENIADVKQKIGARILRAREELGITQTELAHRIGVTRSTVSQWETGTTEPGRTYFFQLAKALGKRAEWLSTGNGAEVDFDAAHLPQQVGPIDIDLLAGCIGGLEAAITEAGLHPPVARRALVIAMLYDHFSATTHQVDTAAIARYIALLR